jgi:hypothetical protein
VSIVERARKRCAAKRGDWVTFLDSL